MDDNGELSVHVDVNDRLPLKISPELKGVEDFIVRRYVAEEAKRDIRRSYLRYVAVERKGNSLKGMIDSPWIIHIDINWGKPNVARLTSAVQASP